jgi:hypothetical protein
MHLNIRKGLKEKPSPRVTQFLATWNRTRLPQFIYHSTHHSSTYLLHSLSSSSSSVNVSFYIRHYEAISLLVRLEQLGLLQKKGPKLHFLDEYSSILDEKDSSSKCCRMVWLFLALSHETFMFLDRCSVLKSTSWLLITGWPPWLVHVPLLLLTWNLECKL